MTEQKNFRIIVIDDNPKIHSDFIKILAFNKADENIKVMKEILFSSDVEAVSSDLVQGITADLPIFEIDTATQGIEGIEKIRLALEEGRPFSLAFVDIRMPPGLDGVKTIKKIWTIDKNIQIVICTAYTDYTWEETIKELGIGDNLLILKKPFDNTAVRQLAINLTKKWELYQENSTHSAVLEKTVEERTNLLHEALSQIRATLESSADGILVVSQDGIVTDYNNKFLKMWDVPVEILKSKHYEDLLEHISQKIGASNKLITDLRTLADNTAQNSATVELNDGQIFEYCTQSQELNDKIKGRVWSFRDITQHINLQKKLEYQATHDDLTSLPNRVLLADRLRHAMAMADRSRALCAVIYFDLDRFKLINDRLSHQVGDKLLNKLSKRVADEVRASDTFGRMGGDEFVLIAQEVVDEKLIIEIIEKISEVVNKPFKIENHVINVTASFGVSLYSKDGKTVEELLCNADLAMSIAKKEGGNNFKFYEKELNAVSLLRFEKEIELRSAIANKEFILHYQPQINTSSNELVGVEALIRWQHPTKGLISSVEFISIAENCGLMLQIGKWILRTACAQNKKWQSQGLPKMLVAVNVTKSQLSEPSFMETVISALGDAGLEPQYLQIDLTEDFAINDEKNMQVLEDIAKLGVKISFGSVKIV